MVFVKTQAFWFFDIVAKLKIIYIFCQNFKVVFMTQNTLSKAYDFAFKPIIFLPKPSDKYYGFKVLKLD